MNIYYGHISVKSTKDQSVHSCGIVDGAESQIEAMGIFFTQSLKTFPVDKYKDHKVMADALSDESIVNYLVNKGYVIGEPTAPAV